MGIINYYNQESYYGGIRDTIIRDGKGMSYDSKLRIKEAAIYKDDFVLNKVELNEVKFTKCNCCDRFAYQEESCCPKCEQGKDEHDTNCLSFYTT